MSTPASPQPNPEMYPPPLDQLAGREFSFYPSIGGFETNLWRMKEANWSEFLVENQQDERQVWVPRRYLGEVSSSDRPVMIVGLSRELEYKAGQVWPVHKRVIEMPRVPAGEPAEAPVASDVVQPMLQQSLRLDASEKKVGRLILVALGGALVLVTLVIAYFRFQESGEIVSYKPVVQESLGLGPADDYFAVTRKLGEPASTRWREQSENVQYQVLEYPRRNLKVILAGRERNHVLYIGAMDGDWKVVDSVNQAGGSNTYGLLAKLPKF